MEKNSSIFERLKLPLYSFASGIAIALGGERAVSYLREREENRREEDLEKLAEKVIKKYKEAETQPG